jgi:hypothetical protein
MVKLPRVVGLVLCNSLRVDPAVGELSLVGVFQSLTFSTWPSPAQPFVAYALLYGGQGEGTMELVVTRLDTERDIYSHKRWFAFPEQGLPIHLQVSVRQCVFPAPGRYGVTLRFDKNELTSRYLDIKAKRETS